MVVCDAILLSVYVSCCFLTGLLLCYCSLVTVQRSGSGHYIAHWSHHGSFLGGHPWVVTPAAGMRNMDRGMGSFARTRVSWLCNSHLILILSISFACKFIVVFIYFCFF